MFLAEIPGLLLFKGLGYLILWYFPFSFLGISFPPLISEDFDVFGLVEILSFIDSVRWVSVFHVCFLWLCWVFLCFYGFGKLFLDEFCVVYVTLTFARWFSCVVGCKRSYFFLLGACLLGYPVIQTNRTCWNSIWVFLHNWSSWLLGA